MERSLDLPNYFNYQNHARANESVSRVSERALCLLLIDANVLSLLRVHVIQKAVSFS